MSDNMKYSSVLDTLVQYAKQIGDRKNAPLTAERYVAAVIDALDGTVAVPEEAAFSAEMEAIPAKNNVSGKEIDDIFRAAGI